MTRTIRSEYEMRVLAAATMNGATAEEMRARAARVSDRHYARAVRALVVSGALVRQGYGPTATFHRDLKAWQR